jgi:hypothetical protein
MQVRYALVLDRNTPEAEHWPASGVAQTRATLRLRHDGHVLLLPRRPGDRRIDDMMAEDLSTGALEPGGVYELAATDARPPDGKRGDADSHIPGISGLDRAEALDEH